MGLNRLFDVIENARETADWRAAFGEAQVVEGKTVIPVAKVTYGFGLGFGQSAAAPDEEGEGGGGGGGASAKPVGALVVTEEDVYFEETIDAGKIALVAMPVGALFVYQLFKTLRVVFGRR